MSGLQDLQQELQGRQTQQASLQALWSQLQPEDEAEESVEAQEKLHVTGSKLKFLLRQVDQDLSSLQQRLVSLTKKFKCFLYVMSHSCPEIGIEVFYRL